MYESRFLLWMGMLLFLLKMGARRQLDFELDSPEALANLNRLSGCDQSDLAHPDTLDHYLGHVEPAEISAKIRHRMVHHLIRTKALDSERVMGHFMIGVDGTQELSFPERHCQYCLERTNGSKTLYYHNVLEAKLLTSKGLAISVGTEFIENTDPEATKQDCELKAFTRLAAQLKRDFPQLRLCLSLDALYANGSVLDICRQNRWKYIITFKKGSLPAVWQEYQTLLELCPQNRKVHHPSPNCRQELAWVENLQYIDDQGRQQQFHAFQCQEQQGKDQRFFAWLTNFSVWAQNVAGLANRGGRLRWKIENEGFNVQKNGGFNLEHAYSKDDQKMKNFYLLLQIAHLILQLMEKGNLLGANVVKLFGSLYNLARRLAESLRNHPIDAEALDSAAAARIQIRLHGL